LKRKEEPVDLRVPSIPKSEKRKRKKERKDPSTLRVFAGNFAMVFQGGEEGRGKKES